MAHGTTLLSRRCAATRRFTGLIPEGDRSVTPPDRATLLIRPDRTCVTALSGQGCCRWQPRVATFCDQSDMEPGAALSERAPDLRAQTDARTTRADGRLWASPPHDAAARKEAAEIGASGRPAGAGAAKGAFECVGGSAEPIARVMFLPAPANTPRTEVTPRSGDEPDCDMSNGVRWEETNAPSMRAA